MLSADDQNTHLMNYLKPVADLVKDLSEMTSVMSTVHLHETEQCMLQVPLSRGTFLNPVPCDSKIRVSIICLPSITCQADLPANSGALVSKY